jgi:hypothetical protein
MKSLIVALVILSMPATVGSRNKWESKWPMSDWYISMRSAEETQQIKFKPVGGKIRLPIKHWKCEYGKVRWHNLGGQWIESVTVYCKLSAERDGKEMIVWANTTASCSIGGDKASREMANMKLGTSGEGEAVEITLSCRYKLSPPAKEK